MIYFRYAIENSFYKVYFLGAGIGSFIQQFKMSPIGKILVTEKHRKMYTQLLDHYLVDFVYMVHPCTNSHEHKVFYYCLFLQKSLSDL